MFEGLWRVHCCEDQGVCWSAPVWPLMSSNRDTARNPPIHRFGGQDRCRHEVAARRRIRHRLGSRSAQVIRVYAREWDPHRLLTAIAPALPTQDAGSLRWPSTPDDRHYALRLLKRRRHQTPFRSRVVAGLR